MFLAPNNFGENRWYLDLKKAVIEKQGTVVLDSLPEGEDICLELAETLIDYLPKRYPVSPIEIKAIADAMKLWTLMLAL
jgi:Protein of unknown function (DUF3445)